MNKHLQVMQVPESRPWLCYLRHTWKHVRNVQYQVIDLRPWLAHAIAEAAREGIKPKPIPGEILKCERCGTESKRIKKERIWDSNYNEYVS
jgi:hypothetical protein